MTERRFEVFRAPHRFAIGARVTLTRRGVFVFNRPAMELLGSPEAVIYLFDRESETVAFAPSSRSVTHAYPVTMTAGNVGQASAVKFCKHYGVKHEHALSCPAELSEGRLVVELWQGTRTATRRRGFAKAAPPAPSTE